MKGKRNKEDENSDAHGDVLEYMTTELISVWDGHLGCNQVAKQLAGQTKNEPWPVHCALFEAGQEQECLRM